MSSTEMRSDLFDALRNLSMVVPEMRAGQLIAAIGELCDALYGKGLWDVEDEQLLEGTPQFRRSFEAAVVASASQQTVR